jgi:hypothetical protein
MTTIIPFKILDINGEGFHLMVKVYINGKRANLIIDSGASKSCFDKLRITSFVKDKKFDVHDQLSTGLGTNKMKSHIAVLKKIKIGTLEIANYKTVLLNLSHVNASYQQIGLKPIDGVLGSDILVEYKAVVDYEKKVLKLKYKK